MNRKFKKFLTIGLAATMLLGSLAGCGKKAEEQPKSDIVAGTEAGEQYGPPQDRAPLLLFCHEHYLCCSLQKS